MHAPSTTDTLVAHLLVKSRQITKELCEARSFALPGDGRVFATLYIQALIQNATCVSTNGCIMPTRYKLDKLKSPYKHVWLGLSCKEVYLVCFRVLVPRVC